MVQTLRFFCRSRIDSSHLICCLHRRDKVIVCRDLGITYFIDDNLENLCYLLDVGTVNNLYWFIEETGVRSPAGISRVRNWDELLKKVL